MHPRIKRLRKEIDTRKTHRLLLRQQIREHKSKIKKRKQEIEELIEAREIIRVNAERTQQRFKAYLENLATLAMRAVFDRPYKLVLVFKTARNKPVCPIEIWEGKKRYTDLEEDVGIGLIDIGAFALKIGMLRLWIRRLNLRPILWLDEPFKNIGTGETVVKRVGQMIKELSRRLKIQIIMNTHEKRFGEIGDRVWSLTHNGQYTETGLIVDKLGS
jgi:hypothetical protein